MGCQTYRARGWINPYVCSPCDTEMVIAEKEEIVPKPEEDVPGKEIRMAEKWELSKAFWNKEGEDGENYNTQESTRCLQERVLDSGREHSALPGSFLARMTQAFPRPILWSLERMCIRDSS
ncbi:hypothetical protein A6R68_01210 [Neotoma lepida]|uniref:Uncharacterized protein n=1 Tax=Neotoma lepida TaxID=56216 RepID=A0A1A6GXC0_NEOLE|nr:hypothetical protein A6R68_01210 [Neotoma lepida]